MKQTCAHPEIAESAGECRFRRRRLLRAFEDKQEGWTLVTDAGVFFQLSNPASVTLWEAIGGRGAMLTEIVALLAARFPQTDESVLFRDAQRFLAQLQQLDFVETTDS